MLWIGIAIVMMAALAAIMKAQTQKTTTAETKYTKRKNFLTPAERSFFGVLSQAVGEDFQIFSKVRIADIIAPESGVSRSTWQKAFNRVAAKHADFILCRKDTLQVECVIELNDKSHNEKNRTERDALVESACGSAKVPFVKFSAKASYHLDEIRKLLPTPQECGLTEGNVAQQSVHNLHNKHNSQTD